MTNRYDYLIVGSGLFGATFAWHAKRAGKRCVVIDKRPQLGGNLFCEKVSGINVHKYGPHIFHTDNGDVWQLVNSIVPFNRFTNSPLANYQGRLYNLPFNMNTFHQMWGVLTPAEAKARIDQQRAEVVARMRREGISEPRNLEEQAMLLIGRDIYERLIKGYTEKQWGRPCSELPAFIIKRLPVRFVFDNNYFNDRYQGIPVGGYNRLIDGLLEGVETRTGCDFFDFCRQSGVDPTAMTRYGVTLQGMHFDRVVYTGPIDEFFGYSSGHLAYRTVCFESETLDQANFQGNAVVNYTEREVPYTRIIEHKHFEMFGAEVDACPQTVISREFSAEWTPGHEPYYPVNDDHNSCLLAVYQERAAQLDNVIFGGRLAEYKYYDMAPIMEKVLAMPV